MQSIEKEFSRIRKILIEHVTSRNAFNITSDLNWLRYLRGLRFVANRIPPKSKVIDIGCGGGHTTAMLKVLRPDILIYGIDIEWKKVWSKLNKYYGCKFEIGNGMQTRFPSNYFDCVMSWGVIEHVESDINFLNESNRLLKKYGDCFVFALPNKYSLNEAFARILNFLFGENFFHHEKRYTKSRITRLVEASGFKIKKLNEEFIIPAQLGRISKRFEEFMNCRNITSTLNKLDDILLKTPIKYFCQSFMIYAKKIKQTKT